MKRIVLLICAVAACLTATSDGVAQEVRPVTPAQRAIASAAREQKYAFLVFYRSAADGASKAMAETVKEFTASSQERATCVMVDVANPEEAALVKQFDVSRAPMPLVLAVAPTGAITGAFPKKISAEQLSGAFVTPAMAHCMKAMQDGRLAMLCVLAKKDAPVPTVAREFAADPMFSQRTVLVGCVFADKAEAELLNELKVESTGAIVLFAPPGVLIGRFGSQATKDQIAAALHKAGKCCDDPNCKHNQQATVPGATTAR